MTANWLQSTRLKIMGARVLYALTTLFAGKERKLVMRDGIRYEVDLAEGIELSLYLFGNFQQHVTRNPLLALPPDAVVIDVGANVGLMTLQYAKAVPHGRVYAFEPTHYALERLRRNIGLNPSLAGRIVVLNAFVSRESRQDPALVAYSSWRVDGSRGDHNHPVHCGTPKDAAGVPAVSLDEFCTSQALGRLDLIKIDTDGHEHEVLAGAEQVVARYRPRIVFEVAQYVMAERGIDFGFYERYFQKHGYRLVDTVSGMAVTADNWASVIPVNGSTDLLALPA